MLSLKILNHEIQSVHVQFKTYQWNRFEMIFNVMFTTKKSLFWTGRDGRDGTNGAKVGNYFCVTT